MSKRRLFTDEFKMGEEVCIIRHRHGWEDGRVSGIITKLEPTYAEVTDLSDKKNPAVYEIGHPRDISR